MVECGSTLDDMAWCCRQTFVINTNNKQWLHWFVCASIAVSR